MMCCKYRLRRWCSEKSLSVLSLGEIIMVIYVTFGSKGRVLRGGARCRGADAFI